ncbi:MAG: 30S ribosome-binding factor RbfA [Acidobacteria bacterium]|nr:30S ribosome-binding factor RbfA [Acidobacteriota bacterium]
MDHRQIRLAEEIQHVIMEMIPYGLRDPRIENASVTGVEMTRDLKLAKIYVEVRGDKVAKQQALRALKRARGYLRRELAMQINVRHIPDLAFYLDPSMESQERVETLLRRIQGEDDS